MVEWDDGKKYRQFHLHHHHHQSRGEGGEKEKTDREKMGERGQNKRKQQNTRETHLDDIERDARRSFGFRFAHGRIFSHDE